MKTHRGYWLGSLLCGALTLPASAFAGQSLVQIPIPGVTGIIAPAYSVEQFYDGVNKILVETGEGIDHLRGATKAKADGEAASLDGLRPGTAVVVHYSVKGSRPPPMQMRMARASTRDRHQRRPVQQAHHDQVCRRLDRDAAPHAESLRRRARHRALPGSVGAASGPLLQASLIDHDILRPAVRARVIDAAHVGPQICSQAHRASRVWSGAVCARWPGIAPAEATSLLVDDSLAIALLHLAGRETHAHSLFRGQPPTRRRQAVARKLCWSSSRDPRRHNR